MIRKSDMKDYKGESSPIDCYLTGTDFIIIQFKAGKNRQARQYLYDYYATGREHVNEMIKRALRGEGLLTYINTSGVRSAYADVWDVIEHD